MVHSEILYTTKVILSCDRIVSTDVKSMCLQSAINKGKYLIEKYGFETVEILDAETGEILGICKNI